MDHANSPAIQNVNEQKKNERKKPFAFKQLATSGSLAKCILFPFQSMRILFYYNE